MHLDIFIILHLNNQDPCITLSTNGSVKKKQEIELYVNHHGFPSENYSLNSVMLHL